MVAFVVSVPATAPAMVIPSIIVCSPAVTVVSIPSVVFFVPSVIVAAVGMAISVTRT